MSRPVPDRSPPRAGPFVPFTDERLDNGLRLILSEDRLAPVAAVNLWYDVGSKHEQSGKTGFAHLFEHIMFQGSRHVAKTEHMGLIQAVGGTCNATTWLDRTNYFETLPSHQLELALWLEADRLATLLDALSQANLDNQREVVKNERRLRYDNQPYGLAYEKLQAALFPPDHPYHHSTIGSMEDLDAASLEDVRGFFRTWYAPNNAVLSIAGDFDPAQARSWVDRHFGPIPPNPAIPALPPTDLPPRIGAEYRERVVDDVPLARLHLGFRAPVFGDPAFEALEVAAQILAGGRGSRLHRRLVREERIAQDVSAAAFGLVGGGSMFVVVATAAAEAPIERVETACLEELDRIAGESVSPDELARAQALIETSELAALQQVEERADRLSMFATLLDDPGRINTHLSRYVAVDADAVLDVSRTVVALDNRAVITYVPSGSGGET
ncbi:MAG: hypothetical protein A2X23_06680 [Chloroflexi bacterium GWC2_73_18]|nr:MAG: hypothetical protein A2X23_06680 [Chloroflexi bacterium GWC2_73_18]